MNALPLRRWLGLLSLAVPLTLAACKGDDELIIDPGPDVPCPADPPCNESITVAPDSPALLVNDPAALQSLTLDRVLSALLFAQEDGTTKPEDLLARMFDTMSTAKDALYPRTSPIDSTTTAEQYHCDDADNPAFMGHAPAMCPRAEASLAGSKGLLVPGDPDYFYPVAVINRLDLMSSLVETCGEYRIIYAKTSGKTDPSNRVFLIFEGTLANLNVACTMSCYPVAQFLKRLEAETDPVALGEKLDQLFFSGISSFPPVLGPDGFGGGAYGTGGRVRLSQHMDADWDMRQFIVTHTPDRRALFMPVAVTNNFDPEYFTADGEATAAGKGFVEDFTQTTESLGARDVAHMAMKDNGSYVSGESLQSGLHASNYAAAAQGNDVLYSAIDDRIKGLSLGSGCPAGDPLTSDSILRRATAHSCAGCHAPTAMLGSERAIGCGLTWPDSLNGVHIDESGALSPALKEVFLPRRAQVLSRYLQACDQSAIEADLDGPKH